MPDLEVGDVVRWKQYIGSGLSQGPFKIIGKSTHYHAINLDGTPLHVIDKTCPGYGLCYYLIAANEVQRDEFLTAASRAVASEATPDA